jgi:hypothetical protein
MGIRYEHLEVHMNFLKAQVQYGKKKWANLRVPEAFLIQQGVFREGSEFEWMRCRGMPRVRHLDERQKSKCELLICEIRNSDQLHKTKVERGFEALRLRV